MLIQRPVPWVFDTPIGHGGMGEVWAARHGWTDTPGAVKVIFGLAHTPDTGRRAEPHDSTCPAGPPPPESPDWPSPGGDP